MTRVRYGFYSVIRFATTDIYLPQMNIRTSERVKQQKRTCKISISMFPSDMIHSQHGKY